MDATRVMVQFLFWTVFIVGVLTAIGAWYIITGLVAIVVSIAVYFYRKKNSERASASLTQAKMGLLTQSQMSTALKAGSLFMPTKKFLRVVETLRYTQNQDWLAQRYQIERPEEIELNAVLLAAVDWVDKLETSTETEVIYVCVEDRVIGHLADVDLPDIYDSLLQAGGAMSCKAVARFNEARSMTSLKVFGLTTN